jgi:hypothetical protein
MESRFMSWSQFLNAAMGRIGALQKQTLDTFTGFNAIDVAAKKPGALNELTQG